MSKKMSIIKLSRIGQDLFDFSDLTWGHPLTHSSTHRYLQTKSNYINKFKLYYISHLTWPHPLTYPLIHTSIHRCGCLNKSWIFKQNWMISIRSRFIWYLVIWPDPTHWPTEPPITPTHPSMGGSMSTNHKSSNRIEWSQLGQDLFQLLVIWPDPTHWPTQPPTHPSMGGGMSTNHKSANRIELSWLGQDLYNC